MLRMTSPAKQIEGMDCILYGDPKVGKTTTLGECGYKVLLADLEGSSSVLAGVTNVDVIPIETYEDMIELGKCIRQGYIDLGNGEKYLIDHEMIAIDSISRFEDMVKEYVATKYAPSRKREIQGKFGAMADWGDLKDLITKMVKAFHTFTKAGEKSKHVMWIAHKALETDDITGLPTSTKIQLQGKNTADIIMSIVDGLFYMAKSVKVDPETKEEKVTYGVLTQNSGIINAAVRQSIFNKDAEKLPSFIVNPNWREIFETMGYKK